MKRCIKASEGGNALSLELQSRGLLGHMQKYCLMAQRYDPLSSGEVYEKYFSVRGDYLAYFAMALHSTPTYDKILDYIGHTTREIEDWFYEVPTVEAIAEYAARNWYGDGDDLIIYLDNCSTGDCLYSMDDPQSFLEDYREGGGSIVQGATDSTKENLSSSLPQLR